MKPATMKTVLVVDDEPDVKLALKIALEENGFEVNSFDDPIIALEKFKKGIDVLERSTQQYGLVLTDIRMPTMNGFEL